MSNTMADLRRECHSRLTESLDGREIDELSNNVRVPHMLGVVPIGVESNDAVEAGTLLDPTHDFWQEYEEPVTTKSAVSRKIKTAIQSLRVDGTFEMIYPHGEEADIVYCKINPLDSNESMVRARCGQCNETIRVPLSIEFDGHFYSLRTHIDCPHCDESTVVSRRMIRE